ncbi:MULTISPECIES: N-formylglutamate amidohydrolase [Burkholderia]|uniref:N-formylglutamate amidohydrolase n=1 Tax=Burkholderia TaxID=32008 RepID=UPI0015887C25|nr:MULTISPECIES: N-formylglutamate amidohydrolase [Burkholderia]MDN7683115.1 N-formylglutamate amidohydrolase [Burkholderia cenocepacia]
MHDDDYGNIYHGDGPILMAAPHIGTFVPEALMLQPAWSAIQGRLADPTGFVLRAVAEARGLTSIAARHHPCVVDCNVLADRRPLSPGLAHANLCRTHTSDGEPLYGHGEGPSEDEIARRVACYWRPYHHALAGELRRLRSAHDHVLLLISHASGWLSPYRQQAGTYDCNVGTHHGSSCDRRLVSALTRTVQHAGRSWVVNGKCADVFPAQHYGMPDSGIHVMEVEFAGNWRKACELEPAVTHTTAALFGAMLDDLLATLTTLPKSSSAPHPDLTFNLYG